MGIEIERRFLIKNNEWRSKALFSEDIRSINDYDTAMILMKSQKGVLIHINNLSSIF